MLAVNNSVRSLLDVYQQKSEYEARLKVQKIKRDLDLRDFQQKQPMPEFKRNIKIVNLEQEEEPEPIIIDVDVQLKEFIERSKSVLDKYYERAYVNDKLSGLSTKETIHRIKDTPANTKLFVKRLLKQLDKHGVRLNPETLEVDLSMIKNKYIKNELQKNPLLKYALLQREDQYNFPHLKNQKIIADELRREVHRLKKQEQLEKEEIEKSKKTELTSGLIDKEINFNYEKLQNDLESENPNEDFNNNKRRSVLI